MLLAGDRVILTLIHVRLDTKIFLRLLCGGWEHIRGHSKFIPSPASAQPHREPAGGSDSLPQPMALLLKLPLPSRRLRTITKIQFILEIQALIPEAISQWSMSMYWTIPFLKKNIITLHKKFTKTVSLDPHIPVETIAWSVMGEKKGLINLQ